MRRQVSLLNRAGDQYRRCRWILQRLPGLWETRGLTSHEAGELLDRTPRYAAKLLNALVEIGFARKISMFRWRAIKHGQAV